MNEMKIDWSDLQLFIAVARGGGLAAGAAISGVSAPTLGRHMADLERSLGKILFNRLPRGYELTLAGQELLIEAEAIEAQILDIERKSSGQDIHLPINISAGTWMTLFFSRHISQISIANQKLLFNAAEHRHNIGRRETTIGLRNARPDELSLAARKTARISFAPYAAADISQHSIWVACTAHTPSAHWVRSYKSQYIQFEVTSPRSLLDLAVQGAGQVLLPCFIGDAEDKLVRTGDIVDELTHDQWLVVHEEDRNLPQIRQTVDLIAKLIKRNRALFEGQ